MNAVALLAAGGATAGLGALGYVLLRPDYGVEDSSGEAARPDVAAPMPMAPAVVPGSPAAWGALGLRAVEVLQGLVGAKEEPPKSNRGPVVDQIVRGVYGDGGKLIGKPWCGRTVRYGFERAAQDLGLPRPFGSIKSSLAQVGDWKSIFGKYKCPPKAGCVAVKAKGSHVVLVSRVEADNVYSVEGNHGDAVADVRRSRSDFSGFYDVAAWARDHAQPPVVSGGEGPAYLCYVHMLGGAR